MPVDNHVLYQPHTRTDAREKVTGEARYAADFVQAGMVHAHLVTSPVALGTLNGFDLDAAKAVPGVLHILTHENMPAIGDIPFFMQGGQAQASFKPLRSREIKYAGQIIAVVAATSPEAAEAAASMVRADITPRSEAVVSIHEAGQPYQPEMARDITVGDADGALASAHSRVDQEYYTSAEHHNPMELYSTTAQWQGERLIVTLPSQWVMGTQIALAEQFNIPRSQVEIRSPYVGGAFGSKATVMPHTTLAVVLAGQLHKPVTLVVTRAQMYTVGSFRPQSRSRVALGADSEGRLQSMHHQQDHQTSRFDDVLFAGSPITTRMYASPNIHGRDRLIATDVNTPGFMRSPAEVPSMYALESAMDELAMDLGMDPVELRRRNDTQTDPVTGVPFSSRSLVACLDRGAERFGWSDRDPTPRSMQDGDELVGWGMATTTYPTHMSPASAHVQLLGDGQAVVRVAAHDIGTGAYTISAQTAAEALGLPLRNVKAKLGSSNYPFGPVAGGSTTTASITPAIHAAGMEVREQLLATATGDNGSTLKGLDPASLTVSNGMIRAPDGPSQSVVEALGLTATGTLEASADWAHPGLARGKVQATYRGAVAMHGPVTDEHAMFAFGAEFVEVRVNPRTREIRVPRLVGAFAAGKVLNPVTARSQLLRGMVWGIGSALHEVSELDHRHGRFVNTNIAEYLVPVNADIQELRAEFIPEEDTVVNPLGAKGLGELGNVGTAAAIANAVFHATGVRVRKIPIRIADLVGNGEMV